MQRAIVIRYPSDMISFEAKYIQGYSDGREESIKRIYEWLMNENREPAQTYFIAGSMRTLAKEIEFRSNENKRKTTIGK